MMLVTGYGSCHADGWPELQRPEQCLLIQANVPISRSGLLQRNRHHVWIPNELTINVLTFNVVKAMCHGITCRYVSEGPQRPYGISRQTADTYPGRRSNQDNNRLLSHAMKRWDSEKTAEPTKSGFVAFEVRLRMTPCHRAKTGRRTPTFIRPSKQ